MCVTVRVDWLGGGGGGVNFLKGMFFSMGIFFLFCISRNANFYVQRQHSVLCHWKAGLPWKAGFCWRPGLRWRTGSLEDMTSLEDRVP